MAQHINLYDPALRRRQDPLALLNVVMGALLLSGAVLSAGLAARSHVPALAAQVAANDAQLKTLRTQLTVLGQQMAARKSDPRLEQDLETAKATLAARGEVLDYLNRRMGTDAVSYADYLRGFARQGMPGLWLTGFEYRSADGGMEIAGRLTEPSLLPEYIRRLNREPAFQGRAFAALRLADGQELQPAAPPAGLGRRAEASAAYHSFRLIPRLEDKAVSQVPAKGAAQAYHDMATKAPGGAG